MTSGEKCKALATALLAAAAGEADPPVVRRVQHHIDGCSGCREDFSRYRAIDAVVADLRGQSVAPTDAARHRLLERLADVRARLVRYAVFPTSLGRVLIAMTEQGVSLVEYVGRRDGSDSWLLRQQRVLPELDPRSLSTLHADLTDYLAGRRTHLDWPLDLRFVRSPFQRAVLEATAQIPYGAVSSYAGIATAIGRPEAVRAVAGALRHNPIPIVLPCHRIVGSRGALVGYSGTRIDLKTRLLTLEGVQLGGRAGAREIARPAMYAWYRGERSYCLPTCGDISEQPIGIVTLFASAREAEASGLVPCGDCRPDLHPLPG